LAESVGSGGRNELGASLKVGEKFSDVGLWRGIRGFGECRTQQCIERIHDAPPVEPDSPVGSSRSSSVPSKALRA